MHFSNKALQFNAGTPLRWSLGLQFNMSLSLNPPLVVIHGADDTIDAAVRNLTLNLKDGLRLLETLL